MDCIFCAMPVKYVFPFWLRMSFGDICPSGARTDLIGWRSPK